MRPQSATGPGSDIRRFRMPGFSSADDLRRTFGGFMDAVRSAPQQGAFAGSGAIIAYRITDLDTTFVLDASVKPVPGRAFDLYVADPKAPAPHVTFEMSGLMLDDLYSGRVGVMDALAKKTIKATGDTALAMRLLPAFARATKAYQQFRAANA